MSLSAIYMLNIISKRRGVIMNYIELLCFNTNTNTNKSEHAEHVLIFISLSVHPIVFICAYTNIYLYAVNVLLEPTAIYMDWESITMSVNVETHKINKHTK